MPLPLAALVIAQPPTLLMQTPATPAPQATVEALRAFLATHPDHTEARVRLVQALATHAARETRKTLQLPPLPERPRLESVLPQRETAPMLEDAQDTRLWGPVVEALDTVFKTDWEASLPGLATGFPVAEGSSPRMLESYRRHLPAVEAALRRRPSDLELWELWLRMGTLIGKRATDLFGTLDRPEPALGLPWPPVRLMPFLLREWRETGQWSTITALPFEWPQIQPPSQIGRDRLGEYRGFLDKVLGEFWSAQAEPRLEALLRTRALGDAEALAQDLADLPHLQPYLPRAVALAARCGLPEVSRRWQQLRPGASKPEPTDALQALLGPRAAEIGVRHLVYVDPSGAGWKRAFRTLLAEGNPFRLLPKELSQESPAGQQLRNRQGWTTGQAGWALLGSGGQSLASGTTLPSATGLVEACRSAGLETDQERLEAFARKHGDNLYAQFGLLAHLKREAEARTRRALGLEKPGAPDRLGARSTGWGTLQTGDASATPATAPDRRLPDEADTAAWGDFAQRLDGLMEQALRRDAGFTHWISPHFIHSPALRHLAARWLPDIEAALRRNPSASHLWEFWFAFAPAAGGRSLGTFLQELEPVPGTSPWPPPGLFSRTLMACREAQAWEALHRLAEPEAQRSLAGKAILTQEVWVRNFDPLIEAHLQLGQEAKAEALLKAWLGREGWPGAPRQAATLARKTKLEALAKAWEALSAEAAVPRPGSGSR